MAKYENTWRMKPFIVKKGAQANLKALGAEVIKEFEKNESAFGPAFYNDLVSKMILFRMVDSSILQSEWYKAERGLKAEIVTYSIALIRHALINTNQDIDLGAIYRRQSVSDKLLDRIISTARIIREHITDFDFTNGVTNPSEFCKSEKGWLKIQAIDVDLDGLSKGDVLSAEEAAEAKKERRDVNIASKSITGLEFVMQISAQEWELIAEFNTGKFPQNHKNVGIPRKCCELHQNGRLLSDKQLDLAKKIRDAAYQDGFDYVS